MSSQVSPRSKYRTYILWTQKKGPSELSPDLFFPTLQKRQNAACSSSKELWLSPPPPSAAFKLLGEREEEEEEEVAEIELGVERGE